MPFDVSGRPSQWHGWLVAILTVVVVGVSTATADAQSNGGWLAVGTGIVTRTSPEPDAGNNHAIAFIFRLGKPRPGWGMRYGFNWFATDLDRPLGGELQQFGRLHVRPLLGGYGYGVRLGDAVVSFDVKGGYAFSSFKLEPGFSDAYRTAMNTERLRVNAANTFVIKPEVNAWIDLSRRFGMNISGGYMLARPELTISSDLGSERRRVRADMVIVQVGVVYSIF